jgi:hypothetical protein
MDLIERRINFDGGKAAGIPREMGAVYSESMLLMGRHVPPRATDVYDRNRHD